MSLVSMECGKPLRLFHKYRRKARDGYIRKSAQSWLIYIDTMGNQHQYHRASYHFISITVFFLSGFSFTNIHDSQDRWQKEEAVFLTALYLLAVLKGREGGGKGTTAPGPALLVARIGPARKKKKLKRFFDFKQKKESRRIGTNASQLAIFIYLFIYLSIYLNLFNKNIQIIYITKSSCF